MTATAPTHIYRLFNEDGELLYIGRSRNVDRRCTEHKLDKGWWDQVKTITLELVDEHSDPHQCEREAIIAERPLYNHFPAFRTRPTATELASSLSHYTEQERRDAGKKLKRGRAALKEANRIAKVMAQSAAAEGVPETTIAAELGVSRITVRTWCGK